MSIDLERSLAELAGSVGDDGAAERMSGQVRHMVGRIRRRRAARQTANGVVGVAAAGAVVLGGAQLASRLGMDPPTVIPATAEPGPWECGGKVEDPNPQGTGTVISLDVGVGAVDAEPPWENLPVATTVGGEVAGIVSAAPPATVVVRDDVVVSVPGVLAGDPVDPALDPLTSVIDQPLLACGPAAPGEPLPGGSYQVVALQTLTLAGGAEVTVRGRTTIELPAAPDPEAAGDTPPTASSTPEPTAPTATAGGSGDELVEARGVLAALLASDPTGAFPSCGSSTDTMDDGMPPLALTGLALGERVYASGEDVLGEVTLTTTEGRSVVGNASGAGAHLVLAQEGRVVGTVYRDAEDATVVDLAPGDELAVPLTGRLQLCEVPMTDGPQLLLPPGTYQAYAVLDVMVKELTEADGTASGETFGTLAFSPPVDVTVG
ncbi:MAG: hypothetical protein JWP95_1228 [Actinotalea sp.]|nr:hypothetical protein [Actinotalea sp.]